MFKEQFSKLSKLVNIFPGSDKIAWFIVGVIISWTICLFVTDPWYGFAGSMMVGGAKEHIDHRNNGAGGIQTWLDWFSVMGGGALISILFDQGIL